MGAKSDVFLLKSWSKCSQIGRKASWRSDCWWFRNPANHLECIKPCKWWDKLLINWCRISSINSMFFSIFQKSLGTHSAMIQPARRHQKLLGNSHPFFISILHVGRYIYIYKYTNPYCVDWFLVSLYLSFIHIIVLAVAFQPAIQPEFLSAVANMASVYPWIFTFHLLWEKE